MIPRVPVLPPQTSVRNIVYVPPTAQTGFQAVGKQTNKVIKSRGVNCLVCKNMSSIEGGGDKEKEGKKKKDKGKGKGSRGKEKNGKRGNNFLPFASSQIKITNFKKPL